MSRAKTCTYTFKQSGGFDHDWFGGTARLCGYDVRSVFDIKGVRGKVDFVVTNSKPKRLTDWQILRKTGANWRMTSSVRTKYLMSDACALLDNDFPQSKVLYVSLYA